MDSIDTKLTEFQQELMEAAMDLASAKHSEGYDDCDFDSLQGGHRMSSRDEVLKHREETEEMKAKLSALVMRAVDKNSLDTMS